MAVTVNLNDYIDTILTKILANQNLCKYLYYDTDTPLAESDIVDTSILADKNNNDRRIYTIPFNPDVHSEQRTTMHIRIAESSTTNEIYYKNVQIKFTILCDSNLWELYSSEGNVLLRPNCIVDELSDIFHREKSIGLGKAFQSEIKEIFMNEYVAGYEICFKNIDFTYNT